MMMCTTRTPRERSALRRCFVVAGEALCSDEGVVQSSWSGGGPRAGGTQ